MYVCLCKGIRESEFCQIVAQHGASPEAVRCALGLDDSCCGRCDARVEELICAVPVSLTGTLSRSA